MSSPDFVLPTQPPTRPDVQLGTDLLAEAPHLATRTDHGSLGDMVVVPDWYRGPTPPGAVRESDYARMTHVYERIAGGTSQLTIDTSNFLAGKNFFDDPVGYTDALAEACAFRQQYMGYVADLVKTPAGLEMLTKLDASKHRTTISDLHPEGIGGNGAQAMTPEYPDGTDLDIVYPELLRKDGSVNDGAPVNVYADPTLTTFKREGSAIEEPWMKDRPRWAFYHELAHAYHYGAGDGAPGFRKERNVDGWPIANAELQATGLGPHANDAISENRIREQMGAPRRPSYGGVEF